MALFHGSMCRDRANGMLQTYKGMHSHTGRSKSSSSGSFGYLIKNATECDVSLLVVEGQRFLLGARERSVRMGSGALSQFVSNNKHHTQQVKLAPGEETAITTRSDFVVYYAFFCHENGGNELFQDAETWEWTVTSKFWEAKQERVGNHANTWWTSVDPRWAAKTEKPVAEEEEPQEAGGEQGRLLCLTPSCESEESCDSSGWCESKYFPGKPVLVYSCSQGQWHEGKVMGVRKDGAVKVQYGGAFFKTIPVDAQDAVLRPTAPSLRLQHRFATALASNRRRGGGAAECW